jgi:alginate O-acetyltransferase complex protein AlgI
MHQFGRQVYSPGWQREFCVGLAFIATGLFEKKSSLATGSQ